MTNGSFFGFPLPETGTEATIGILTGALVFFLVATISAYHDIAVAKRERLAKDESYETLLAEHEESNEQLKEWTDLSVMLKAATAAAAAKKAARLKGLCAERHALWTRTRSELAGVQSDLRRASSRVELLTRERDALRDAAARDQVSREARLAWCPLHPDFAGEAPGAAVMAGLLDQGEMALLARATELYDLRAKLMSSQATEGEVDADEGGPATRTRARTTAPAVAGVRRSARLLVASATRSRGGQ